MADMCAVCGRPILIGEFPCIATARPHERGTGARIGDECDFYDPHLEQRFTSKAAHDRAIKARGWVRKVRHAPLPGSDKSALTQSWNVCPAALLISEADRIAQLHAWDRVHGLNTEPRAVAVIVPAPAPAFAPDVQRSLAEQAAGLGL